MNCAADKPAGPVELNILFLGNSYTNGMQGAFARMVADSPHAGSTLRFVWAGGITLERLIRNGRAVEAIDSQPWDFVVLQEQSQLPALPGRRNRMFHDAVDTLVEKVREAGAEPVLYMTWGRRDWDKANRELLPDFETMQQKLSDAYRQAAARNRAHLAPVGEAWRKVRAADAMLGRALYQDDGSHPSDAGAFVTACVFYRVLFSDSLDGVSVPEGLDDREATLIKDAVLSMEMAGAAAPRRSN